MIIYKIRRWIKLNRDTVHQMCLQLTGAVNCW